MKLKTFFNGVALTLSLAAISAAQADITLRHALTGETLDLSFAKKGGNTDKFKQFMQTGKNPYNGDAEAAKKGESLYMTGCSGCHGHEAEGKLGPGLADDYWTYPRGLTDQGLFEILFGGANGMMVRSTSTSAPTTCCTSCPSCAAFIKAIRKRRSG